MPEPLPPAWGPEPVRISEGLERVVRSMGGPSVRGLRVLFDDWPGVVGASLAAQCTPVAIDGDVLVLAVHDSGWASELRWLEAPLVEAIDRAIEPGVITAVRLTVRP